jgi:hypothetical protein
MNIQSQATETTATILPNHVLKKLLRKQLQKDYSNLTKEEKEQLLINEQKNMVGAKLALVKEEKQKQLTI